MEEGRKWLPGPHPAQGHRNGAGASSPVPCKEQPAAAPAISYTYHPDDPAAPTMASSPPCSSRVCSSGAMGWSPAQHPGKREPSTPVNRAAAPLAVRSALPPHTTVVVLTPAHVPSLLKAEAGSPANIQRERIEKRPDPSAAAQAEMFLCLGKCQRKKFPLRVGLCLQDFKPLVWTITASV